MSSETSTKTGRASAPSPSGAATGFEAWHLFVILTLLLASAGAVAARGSRSENVVFVCLTILAGGGAAYGVFRTLWPLVRPDLVDSPEMLGGRTRVALEREKALVLRAIKDLEFDRAMGKVSQADWQEMTTRLRVRAMRLIRQLDRGSAVYRELIEREASARLSAAARTPRAGAGGSISTSLLLAALVAGSLLVPSPSLAQMEGMGGGGSGMPDARAMSGIPRPSESAPPGSVSVRLVRGQLSNIIVSHAVEFTIGGRKQTVLTDDTGHAVCTGVPPGAVVQAAATVDGERLESQAFQMAPRGGMVLMLVASEKGGAGSAATATVGPISLGAQTRILTQFEDETLQVYYALDVVNGGATPVRTATPVVIDLPGEAQNPAVLEASSAYAVAKGPHVTLTGPFPPGSTSVQIAFSLPPSAEVAVRQAFPVPAAQVTVAAEKVGAMALHSSQLRVFESTEDGRLLLVGSASGLKAGQPLAFDSAGLPHHPAWPRHVALGLAALCVVGGVWGAARTRGRPAVTAARRQLEARRERVFSDLLGLDRATGASDGRRDERRGQLVRELESIYGELDTEGPGVRGDQESAT